MILMDESTRSPDEVNSPACLNKKRKSQNEPQEMPSSKHVCCDRIPKHESSLDSAKDSNSLQHDTGSAMSTDIDETKTELAYFDMCSSEACTFSESRLLDVPRSIGPESSSTGKLDCLDYHRHGMENLDSDYDGSFIEFGNGVDCGCSGNGNDDGVECNCADKEIENMIYSNEIAPSDYVLSSGRWSVNQDTEEEGKKELTIDKEFEQYFSMLML